MTAAVSLLGMTSGAVRMAETDPHGWTLTLIAVTTVFSALVILYFIYSLTGKLSQRRLNPSPGKIRRGQPDAETAAAIALALEAEAGGEVQAAVAMALHLYFGEAVHDAEPGFITIAHDGSAWADKTLTFRKTPVK